MKDKETFDIKIEASKEYDREADRKTMCIPVEAETQLYYNIATGKFYAISVIEDNEFRTLEVELEEVDEECLKLRKSKKQ